jgi:hypothetical protein
MSEKRALLARCTKCKKHGHWKFADGTKSEEFATTSEAALEFLRAISDGRASHEQIPSILSALENSGFPRSAITEVIPVITGAIASLFSEDKDKSVFDGCDPTLN